jgi:hypothetical protein
MTVFQEKQFSSLCTRETIENFIRPPLANFQFCLCFAFDLQFPRSNEVGMT